MMDLVIFALRRVAGGLLQRRFQVLLADLFDVWVSRNGIGIESLAVESIQGITVRDQPRLHDLRHQLVVLRTDIRQIPAISTLQVFLWSMIHRTLRVN